MDIYPAAAELIRDVPVEKPVHCFSPHQVTCAAWRLDNHLPGEMPYAVLASHSLAAVRSRAFSRGPWLI